jgi:arsenate reductase
VSATQPTVLYLCIHNAGRSQMALGWFTHLANGRARALSAGSEPAHSINPTAVEAMAEVGIDIAAETPKRWTDETLGESDVVVTMGCGDTCPVVPGTRYEDWPLEDPAGKDLDTVRRVRDEIRERVEHLLQELDATD